MMANSGTAPIEAAPLRGHCVVTGVAGFIGSHLAERLLDIGCTVTGADCFTDYYPRELKLRNLQRLSCRAGFELRAENLADGRLSDLVEDAAYIFHQAGQPGVRTSWGDDFAVYLRDNVLATQRLLEAARGSRALRRFVYASSSSVYGNATELPVSEAARPQPYSPYGVTKLAAEHLCSLYAANFGLPTVSLRYFTVYGPRQRPDMAFARFFRALLDDGTISLHGDGEQTRDFTFVADAVEANLLAGAGKSAPQGAVYNIGGGSRVTVNEVIGQLEALTGRRARLAHLPAQEGDARHTFADTGAAAREIGFRPRVQLADGLRAQLEWTRDPEGAALK
jgi:nucleoside-diphosphate-sugar epimerase